MKLNEITLRNTHLMFEEAGSGMMKFAPGKAAIGEEWHVFLPDEKAYVVAIDEAEANRIQAAVDELVDGGKTPAVITSDIKNQVGKPNGFKGTFNRQWSGVTRAVTAIGFNEIRNRTWAVEKLGRAINNPVIKTIGSLGARLGPAATFVGMMFGCAAVVDDIELEIEAGAEDVAELRKLQGVLQAQMFTYAVLALKSTFGQRRLLRLVLLPIKAVVRTAQGAAALSGVGTVPSLLSLIVTEAAWLVIPIIISTPMVQRALAEYIAGSIFGDAIAGAGAWATNKIRTASALTDGAYGTDIMVNMLTGRNASGFEEREAGAPTGEYYSDSEWAKKVFGGLLFPPSQASVLVPYINAGRRDSLLSTTMRLNTMDSAEIENQPEQNNPEETGDGVDPTTDANGETAADRGRRTREASLQTDYSNPNFTRAQPMNGPR